MNKNVDQLNYLAIALLEKLGNIEPTEGQIELLESILLQTNFHKASQEVHWKIYDTA